MSAVLLLGCGAAPTPQAEDITQPDVMQALDTPQRPLPEVDLQSDAAAPDVPPSPFGHIEGDCDLLPSTLAAEGSALLLNTFDFDGDPFASADLDPDALAIFDERNAGGSSKCSEVFSMELMDDCADASLYKTETQVAYDQEGSLIDYVMLLDERRVGVSVTRAYKGPLDTWTAEEASALLTKKLSGLAEASANVSAEDAWDRQVLHVWTLRPDWADMVQAAWDQLSAADKANVVVIVTLEKGSEFVTTDTCDD